MRNQQNLEFIPTLPQLSPPKNSLKIRPCELKLQEVTYLHFHNNIELGLCISGEGKLFHGGEEYDFYAGDAQMIFPYAPHIHRTSNRKSSVWLWLSIDPESLFEELGIMNFSLINKLIASASPLSGLVKEQINPLLYEKIASFLKTASTHGFSDHVHMSHDFLGILIAASDTADTSFNREHSNNKRVQQIAPALRQINHDIDSGDSSSVDELARLCAMSPTGFRNIFHECIGTSPKSYIQISRIRRAKELLRQNNTSILDIAYSVGYKNISGFNRAFLEIAGETPSNYKKRHL